ncbi:U-box domain-containing protein 35-like [Zingiber officinale]|uniref:U-box domain-containing protein 35-like n=1 Tax=Zingiber officinale TaxID=94328 RepID=UPI001C4BF4CE|nr:U-box domain-containing protein 35-like [Zingiber officinale]
MDSVSQSFPLAAVAVDKDKSSQGALKWALDNVAVRGQTLILIHVNTHAVSPDSIRREILTPFRCFCTRKDIKVMDMILEGTDVAKGVVEFISQSGINKLVVGASRGGFVRYLDILLKHCSNKGSHCLHTATRSFRNLDISVNIHKTVPDFCTAYVISKGKLSSVKNAIRPPPAVSPLRIQLQKQANADQPSQQEKKGTMIDLTCHLARLVSRTTEGGIHLSGDAAASTLNLSKETESIRSPLTRGAYAYKSDADLTSGSDISFVSSGRRSTDQVFPPRIYCLPDNNLAHSFESRLSPRKSVGVHSAMNGYSFSQESFASDASSLECMPWNLQEYQEAEINRLKLELKQTMDMYNAACKEALLSKQKAKELHHSKMEGKQRLEIARLAEEAALVLVEKEKAKCKAALEAAEAAQRKAELEAHKRREVEIKAMKQSVDKNPSNSFVQTDARYRRYKIEEIEEATEYFAADKKVGEGGYGPVYKCYLDHTPVAVKVLRPDAAQGRSQFQHEVEILSCIRHPNMVLLLGACPEYGCLVYEYMANGSLEDRLFRRGTTPPIPWQYRFRIAAEIATCLLFLHQTKPEPLVHRDLKPANILLDQNYTSKISDVGLARLLPPSVADQVTQYRMTTAAGTFCYIDPEYQQTGMLGTRSDIYSFGILLLQLITAKPPMGLTHQVERSIETGTFRQVLDPSIQNWPIDEALRFAKLALNCAELRRKDRPDLGTVVLPELNWLRAFGEENTQQFAVDNNVGASSSHDRFSVQDIRSGPLHQQSGYQSSSQFSGSSIN